MATFVPAAGHPLRVDWDGSTRGAYLLAPRAEA